MYYEVLTGILFFSVLLVSGDCIGISSKLDFDENAPKLIRTLNVPKHSKREDPGTVKEIGVVCTNGGCNTTKSSETDDGMNAIKTDVLVHVQTSVAKKENKTQIIDDTPDVPIVVGTDFSSGRNVDSTQQFRPIIMPQSTFVPTFTSFDSEILRTADDIYLDDVLMEPQVDVHVKTLDGNVDTTKYKVNGLELHVPYFEPSFNNHYFGEHPPPQLVWYPKRTVQHAVNPVEFRNIQKATWSPSVWPSPNAGTGTFKHNEPCQCRDHHHQRGLQWNPPNRRVYSPDPGSQINDKLAPLN